MSTIVLTKAKADKIKKPSIGYSKLFIDESDGLLKLKLDDNSIAVVGDNLANSFVLNIGEISSPTNIPNIVPIGYKISNISLKLISGTNFSGLDIMKMSKNNVYNSLLYSQIVYNSSIDNYVIDNYDDISIDNGVLVKQIKISEAINNSTYMSSLNIDGTFEDCVFNVDISITKIKNG
jgi:hypothetical protein